MNTRALLKARVVRNPSKPERTITSSLTYAVTEGVQAPIVEAPIVEAPASPVLETLPEEETPVSPALEAVVETPVEAEVSAQDIPAQEEEPNTIEALLEKSQTAVNSEVGAGSWDSVLDEVYALEAANKNRKRVLAAIEARKASLLA